MGQRTVQFVEQEFYHLYNRGTDKRNIFLDHSDYERFTHLLFLCNSENRINFRDIKNEYEDIFEFDRGKPLVAIGAYCLMPNHFHILATQVSENGMTMFMNKLGTSYSMYFNKKYERTGALFEGRFKAQHADHDAYLKYLFSYIHLNPIKLFQPDWKEKGITNVNNAFTFLSSYEHSSWIDYHRERAVRKILSREMFPEYFLTADQHKEELLDWLNFSLGPA